ncbi:MAG: efflux RND transporter periplasmic adaptor subunit [Clostridia bacterium]|nr:efflux RND transporter periplasmic adaptor subunit [Clostridia bacterium]
MKRKLLAVLLVVGLVALVGCGKEEEAPKAEVETTPVKVAKVSEVNLSNEITISGKIAAGMEVAVVPKVGGKVTQVTVNVGQRVKKGQVLVTLDGADLAAQIKAAEAGLQVSRAGQKQSAIRYQEAKDNFVRMEALYKEGAISQAQYDAAKNGLDFAASNYDPTKGGTLSDAQIKQSQANIDAMKANYANMVITAPIDGVVASRSVDPGEMAAPGAPVVNLVNTSEMVVEGSLAESEVNLMKVGQEVKVLAKAAGDEAFTGKVESISPSADARTKAYPIKIKIKNPDEKLKSGMFAEIKLATEARTGVVAVPKEAVIERGTKKVVFVVKGDTVSENEVAVGIANDKLVEVTKGVNTGDQVVVAGQQNLADKAKVTVQ